ncbi:hypothetical protein Bca52824_035951 [Brassica carinata]|uniref:Uncharacterized protein n=1 Tax=Brassica carinata TaxID=52824 RepID=A0A8X7S325_BRACI|nr:hypothetical protein Bca52824_035951 [Brassica carinata]
MTRTPEAESNIEIHAPHQRLSLLVETSQFEMVEPDMTRTPEAESNIRDSRTTPEAIPTKNRVDDQVDGYQEANVFEETERMDLRIGVEDEQENGRRFCFEDETIRLLTARVKELEDKENFSYPSAGFYTGQASGGARRGNWF